MDIESIANGIVAGKLKTLDLLEMEDAIRTVYLHEETWRPKGRERLFTLIQAVLNIIYSIKEIPSEKFLREPIQTVIEQCEVAYSWFERLIDATRCETVA